jgi:alpha-ketoglutarate-dependent taurine dioxygenase
VSQQGPDPAAAPAFQPPRRRAVQIAAAELIRTSPLVADRGAPAPPDDVAPAPPGGPLLVEPNVGDLNLVSWADGHRDWIDHTLDRAGALLFRGFGIDSVSRFEALVAATSQGALPYVERSSPRTQVAGGIYTSTDHPPDQEIFLHNEQSYNLTFPRKIYFCCLTAAASGGATPIADVRRVHDRIAEPLRRRFLAQGYLYVRNFGGGLGLPWQAAFQTDDPRQAEDYCRRHAIDWEWREGGRLRTRQARPAIARHPRTGEPCWFNHATFFHVSTLPAALRQRLLAELDLAELPNHTFYGDGSEIEPEVMEQLRDAYRQETRAFAWQPGDVLVLDNMMVAHGREPFSGRRQVIVGMADPVSWDEARPAASERGSR